MRPQNLKTKIFLDSGDPAETKEIINLLGFLDGQTTNPTLISKNPYAKERFERGEKFSKQEIYDFYRKVVTDIARLISNGSISIEVYACASTKAEEM
jgi:transaldolase